MESEVSASDSFAVHLRVLVWCGYAELRSARPAAKHLHRLYRFMILSCFTLYILLEAIYMVMRNSNLKRDVKEKREPALRWKLRMGSWLKSSVWVRIKIKNMVKVLDDLVAFARVTLLLLVHCAAFVKMATYRLKFNSIQTIINGFNEPLLNPENVTSRRTISDSVTTSKFIVNAFVSTSLCTCVLWSLFPAIEYLRERGVRFYYWLFDIDYSMSPKDHIARVRKTALFYTARLEAMLGRKSKLFRRNKRTTYKMCIRTVLTYASPVYAHAAPKTLDKLQHVYHAYKYASSYEIVTLCTAAVTTLIAVANTALDALVAAVLAQCKTQLTILRHNLEHLPVKCQEMTNAGEAAHNAALLRELAACMQHYAKIMQISRKFLSIFGGAIFFQFGCSGWIICMTAYKLANHASGLGLVLKKDSFYSVEHYRLALVRGCLFLTKAADKDYRHGFLDDCYVTILASKSSSKCYYSLSDVTFQVRPTTMEFASLVLFLICMLLELFLFCYYGNEVKVESELLTQSVFAASWPETPHAFRKALVVVMERFKRPLKPVAGLIIPLSLETFVKVLCL
ncbi:Odorant receptor 94b [Eumeta japonica]|uniref:Odorant receptor 94b n=1 Tax=Eumeta variegata TaxID=151549 RepID=A0A4C1SDK4_EUMVA|nr:Odorant receptor 94b [Eumeta japonica]